MKPVLPLHVQEDPVFLIQTKANVVRGVYVLKNSEGKEFQSHVLIRDPIRLEVANKVVECESATTVYQLQRSTSIDYAQWGERYLPPLKEIQIFKGIISLISGKETQNNQLVTGILVEETEEYYKINTYGETRTGMINFLK